MHILEAPGCACCKRSWQIPTNFCEIDSMCYAVCE
jgi:hypothetical protein